MKFFGEVVIPSNMPLSFDFLRCLAEACLKSPKLQRTSPATGSEQTYGGDN
jgi:hypothetical protein